MSRPKTTHNTRQPTPFLDLPAEIRNLIYDFTFDTCTLTVRTSRANPYHRGRIPPGLGLAYANRQIHAETALVMYKQITFAFINIDSITKFLRKRNKEQIDVIRNVQLSILHGYRIFGGGREVFTAETFRFLDQFPSLRHVVLIEMSGHKEYVVLGQLEQPAKMIRKWRPGVEIDVRDMYSKWMLAL